MPLRHRGHPRERLCVAVRTRFGARTALHVYWEGGAPRRSRKTSAHLLLRANVFREPFSCEKAGTLHVHFAWALQAVLSVSARSMRVRNRARPPPMTTSPRPGASLRHSRQSVTLLNHRSCWRGIIDLRPRLRHTRSDADRTNWNPTRPTASRSEPETRYVADQETNRRRVLNARSRKDGRYPTQPGAFEPSHSPPATGYGRAAGESLNHWCATRGRRRGLRRHLTAAERLKMATITDDRAER